jgi:hypothetical protein
MNKRIIIIMQLLFFSFLPVCSFGYGNNFNLGVLGLGVSTENEPPFLYFYGSVINFTYQPAGGFGVEISPLHFSSNNEGSCDFSLTFINTSLFYDFFKHEHFILGPFGSINAIKYNNPEFFELHAGITFSIRNINFWDTDFYKDSIFGFDFLAVELGYKYNNRGKQGFYAFIGMDLLTTLYSYCVSHKGDIEKYQKEHPGVYIYGN